MPEARARGRGPPRRRGAKFLDAREASDGDAGMAAKFPSRYRMVKTEELLPYENNARTHSDARNGQDSHRSIGESRIHQSDPD